MEDDIAEGIVCTLLSISLMVRATEKYGRYCSSYDPSKPRGGEYIGTVVAEAGSLLVASRFPMLP
jgi:hypothetical protein